VKNLLLVSFIFLVAGCASGWEPVPTEYVFKDWPSENSVEVLFTNDTDDKLCLLPEHWPNQAGKINQASEYVFLLVSGERFPIEDFNTGYCPGGCALVVRPGATVSSSIAYDDFQLPTHFRHAPKQLELPVVAYTCPHET
jgi:hypothetical protein